MSKPPERLELLVATGDRSFGRQVADAVEATEEAVSTEYVDATTRRVVQSKADGADGVIVDDRIAEPTTVVDRLTDGWNLPVVVLTDPRGNGETVTNAIEAGATDIFPRTTATAQYELVVERLIAAQQSRETVTPAEREQPDRTLFERIPDGLVVHDPVTGEIVDVNEQFCAMHGYDRSELVDESIDIVTAPGEAHGSDAAREMIQQAHTEGSQRFEWRNQRRSGETFPVEVSLRVVEIGGARRVLASVKDITERKRREREYEQIFNTVQDAITVHDPHTGEMVDVNDTFCELVGYDRETILEMGTRGVSVEAEGYTQEYADEIVTEVMREGRKGPYDWMIETKDGERRVTEVVATRGKIGGEERIISTNRDVTERRELEQEYEQIFNGVNDAIAVFDPETGEITDVNEPYYELLGYDDLETIQELGVDGLSASDEGYTGERGTALVRDVNETGESETVEWRAETVDGRRLWLEVTLSPAMLRGEDRVLSIQRDITERKRREREYEQIFNGVNEVITVHDPETGELLDVNDAFCDLLGYDRDEIIESGVMEYTPSGQGYTTEKAKEFIREVVETGEPKRTEWAVETADGEIRQLDVTGTTVEIGGDLRYVAIDRDVTERKRREREFERIFNGVQDTIAVFDPDTLEFLDVNEAYLEMFGYGDIDELRERGVSGLSLTDEGYTEQLGREIHQRVAESGQPERVEWQGETRSGERIWLDVKVAPAVIGGEQRTISVQRDVTERRRREQRLEVFNRILRHNLRNRLDVIRSHAEELTDRNDHATRIVDAVDELAATGKRAREIDRIMSKDETLEEVDIAGTLRETIEAMEPARNNVAVTTDFSGEPQIRTHETTVTIAVESALKNALEHAASAVTVGIESRSNECVITIADDGPGIPEDALVPIETGRETTLQHGTGLGLWQLRWSVNKFNGKLSFETGSGTTVRITVPDRRE